MRLYQKRWGANTRAYVQFRGSEFHTRNAQFRQLQEQRRAKAGYGLKPYAVLAIAEINHFSMFL